jgi:hypothetical protein
MKSVGVLVGFPKGDVNLRTAQRFFDSLQIDSAM